VGIKTTIGWVESSGAVRRVSQNDNPPLQNLQMRQIRSGRSTHLKPRSTVLSLDLSGRKFRRVIAGLMNA
jgi:hypothetical protein